MLPVLLDEKVNVVPVREQSQHNAYVSKDLASCTHVFVRNDAARKPLQQPYNGPFKVLERTDKYFTLDLNGWKDKVSLDCLKPAYLEPDSESSLMTDSSPLPQPKSSTPFSSPATTAPTRTTCSVRHVHFPDRLMGLVDSFANSLEGE